MGVSGRDRENAGWGSLFAGLVGGAILVVAVAALAWFYFIWPMKDALPSLGDPPASLGPGYYHGPDVTPDLSDEYRNSDDDYDMPATWVCSYDITFNDNYHDDVLCTDGVSTDRPYLLPDDSFITPDEIMREAARYEDYLNS